MADPVAQDPKYNTPMSKVVSGNEIHAGDEGPSILVTGPVSFAALGNIVDKDVLAQIKKEIPGKPEDQLYLKIAPSWMGKETVVAGAIDTDHYFNPAHYYDAYGDRVEGPREFSGSGTQLKLSNNGHPTQADAADYLKKEYLLEMRKNDIIFNTTSLSSEAGTINNISVSPPISAKEFAKNPGIEGDMKLVNDYIAANNTDGQLVVGIIKKTHSTKASDAIATVDQETILFGHTGKDGMPDLLKYDTAYNPKTHNFTKLDTPISFKLNGKDSDDTYFAPVDEVKKAVLDMDAQSIAKTPNPHFDAILAAAGNMVIGGQAPLKAVMPGEKVIVRT